MFVLSYMFFSLFLAAGFSSETILRSYVFACCSDCISMAMVEAADEATHACRACGYKYSLSAGRVHGRHFLCQGCHNVQNTIRRNLGDTEDVQNFSAEDSTVFFRSLRDAQKSSDCGSLSWKTIRAGMISRLTEEHISKFSTTVAVQEFPLSVYTVQGWAEEVIKKFPCEYSDAYGCEVYKVPVRTLSWQEAFQKVESRILEKERLVSQKKRKNQDDLDVPQAEQGEAKSAKADAKAAKQEAATTKKTLQQNERLANAAAKALGPLTSVETSLQKCVAKAEEAEDHDAAALEMCKENLAKAMKWRESAREAVNRQHILRASEEQEEKAESLTPLPFDGEELKIFQKQSCEAAKALKQSVPKKAAKAKAEPKRKATEAGAEEKPKRARGKTTPKSG